MKLTECHRCAAPVRVVFIDEQPLEIDPITTIHGWIHVQDLASGKARETDRGPARYRPHYETCRGNP